MIEIDYKFQDKGVLQEKHPNALFADVTGSAKNELICFSPYYCWGDIPMPYTNELVKGKSVMGIWKSLAVWQEKNNYKQLIGFKRGPHGRTDYLLNQIEARLQIMVYAYRFIFDYKVNDLINRLREKSENRTIVLLDKSINCNINDITSSYSLAYLIKAYAEGLFPYNDVYIIKNIHHFGCGRRVYSWEEKVRVLKEIPRYTIKSQLDIEFDKQTIIN